ncbi:hypothetical protein MRX96_028501 [Rhipicephalus microplus]
MCRSTLSTTVLSRSSEKKVAQFPRGRVRPWPGKQYHNGGMEAGRRPKATTGHVDQLQCGTTDFWIPTDDTSAFFRLPSTSQNFRMPGPDIPGNNARTSGTTWNLEPNMEYYRVDHLPSSFDSYDNGSTGVLNPTFVRRYWEASTSCTDIEQPSSTPEDNTRRVDE